MRAEPDYRSGMPRAVVHPFLSPLCAFALVSATLPVRADAPAAPTSIPTAPATAAPTTQDEATLDVAGALALALEHNPSFRASLFDAVAARAQTTAATDARVPVLTASASGAYTETITGTASGAVRTNSRQIAGSLGIAYTSPVGTVIEASLGSTTQWRAVNRDPSTTQLFLIGPNYLAQATIAARQPLLRGRGREAVLAEQRQAEANEASAGHDVDDAASQLVADVLAAYWELWYAERALEVQAEAAALATRQHEEARARQRLGTIATADVFQFATAEASLRETLVTARATRTARALELARLLGDPSLAATSLRVADVPPEATEPPPISAIVAALTRRSPALLAIREDIRAAEQRVVAARNAARARLDLTTGAGAAALFMEDDYPGLQLPGGRPAFSVNGGLELELPLASNRARGELAAANAQLEAAEQRYAASVASIQADVATRHAELVAAIERITLVTDTANVAAELAAAERGRLTLGTTTPAVLIEAQQQERESRLRLDRTAADAAIAALRFEDGAGLLLERFSITTYAERER